MDFQSKWMKWSSPTPTSSQESSAKSAETEPVGGSGTFGTSCGNCRWLILDSFSVDPSSRLPPTNNEPLPFKDLWRAIHLGKVALVWSRPCQAWTYWVHSKSDVKRGRERFPSAVIYTAHEIDLLCRVKVDQAFLQVVHSTKEVLGVHLESLERPKNAPAADRGTNA